MKKIIAFSIFYLLTAQLFAQKDTIYSFGERPAETSYYFGFNLIESIHGEMCHFALIKPNRDGKPTIKLLTKESFIYQAAGFSYSIANPKKENLFKKYKIENPNILDELWRLRYDVYPYEMQRGTIEETVEGADSLTTTKEITLNTKGWSTYVVSEQANNRWGINLKKGKAPYALIPSKNQMKILEEFGIERISDYFYGEKAFELLKAMQDPNWVNTYKTTYDE